LTEKLVHGLTQHEKNCLRFIGETKIARVVQQCW